MLVFHWDETGLTALEDQVVFTERTEKKKKKNTLENNNNFGLLKKKNKELNKVFPL